QALDIAHDVASRMANMPAEGVSGTLIYVAVTSRLRSYWRSTGRRAALEGRYHTMLTSATRVWADPGAALEWQELHARIAATLAAMPPRMREVFTLIRDEEFSYKDAAGRLGVSVGTVHTQFSRANALLRECVARYHADAPALPSSKRSRLR